MKYAKLISDFLNLGVLLGAWSVYNATHHTRQNGLINLAVNRRKKFFF